MITNNLIKVKDNSEKTKVKKAKATIQILFDFKIKWTVQKVKASIL